MTVHDYPVDVRADYPERSSRGWAALTIFLLKFLALVPHFIILVFLGIAQFVVAFIAQFVVAFKGEYPPGMHAFVTGVLRWGTRVTAFVFSLNDRYPPFTLKPVADYPVDVVVERPARPSRVYAVFTIVVELLALIGLIWLTVWLVDRADTLASWSTQNGGSLTYNLPSYSVSGLLLRQLAAIPHFFVLFFVGIAAFVLWFVVQWVILFGASFPRSMWDVVAGYVRWTARVNAYSLGLVDCYPPFTMSPSLTAAAPVQPSWPAAPPAPPAQQTPSPPAAPAATPPTGGAPPADAAPAPQAPAPQPPSEPQPPESPSPPESPRQP